MGLTMDCFCSAECEREWYEWNVKENKEVKA